MKATSLLLIENDSSLRGFIETVISKSPKKVELTIFGDGAAPLDYESFRTDLLETCPAPPDLIFLNADISDDASKQFLTNIKADASLRSVPIVVFGDSARENIHAAFERKANSYCVKPENEAELSEKITHLLYYWLEVNESPKKA